MSELRDNVRLKPYDPRLGQNLRKYGAPWGAVYTAGTWVIEDPSVASERAAYLAGLRDKHSGKPSFDVLTRADAAALQLAEEAGDLELVRSTVPARPRAPTGGPAPRLSDLNLPAPKSELAAEARAAAEKKASAPPPAEEPPKKGKPARRRRPASKG